MTGEEALKLLLDRLANAYQQRDDYPPFALAPWEDRNRYYSYASKLAYEIIDAERKQTADEEATP